VSNHPFIECRPWREPRDLFAEYAKRPHCVWLDSARGQGISILAAEPFQVFRTQGRRCELITANGVTRLDANPFDVLKEHLAAHSSRLEGSALPAEVFTKAGPVEPFPLGAAIGYFGYDLKNFVEKLPANAVDNLGLPDCWFGFYDHLIVFDHAQCRMWEVIGGRGSCRAVSHHSTTPLLHHSVPSLTSNFTRDSYCRTVLRAKEYIAAGDIYQVNLSQRFQCGIEVSPAEAYLALRESNPAPYCAYLDIGEAQILSSSPECFLKVHGRHVVTRPIKGTRPRGTTPEEDARIAAELLASPKDNAELVMITDLERNDLGRVCEFGSIHVSELVRVESYATVHHLVATVEGQLRRDVSPVDCVRACFPGGSITGAPKIRAMQIIDELEPHARGVYTGAVGFLGFNGVSHLNIAIRTAVYQAVTTDAADGAGGHRALPTVGNDEPVERAGPGRRSGLSGRLTFHAGGGIVADSEPDAEYDETLAKAQGIFNAIDQLRLRERPVRA
jgi:para-aminobenzoate synthetase component 1